MATKIQFPDPDIRPLDIATEIDTLQRNYAVISKNVGKFVLIRGTSILGYYNSYQEATDEGYRQAGLGNFLARRIKAREIPLRAMRFGIQRLGRFKPKISKAMAD
jgi:hypothetical protein